MPQYNNILGIYIIKVIIIVYYCFVQVLNSISASLYKVFIKKKGKVLKQHPEKFYSFFKVTLKLGWWGDYGGGYTIQLYMYALNCVYFEYNPYY